MTNIEHAIRRQLRREAIPKLLSGILVEIDHGVSAEDHLEATFIGQGPKKLSFAGK